MDIKIYIYETRNDSSKTKTQTLELIEACGNVLVYMNKTLDGLGDGVLLTFVHKVTVGSMIVVRNGYDILFR